MFVEVSGAARPQPVKGNVFRRAHIVTCVSYCVQTPTKGMA